MGSEHGVGWRAKWSDLDLEEKVKINNVFDMFFTWFLMALRDVISMVRLHRTISTQYISTQYQYTVLVHSISTQYQYTVSVHSMSTQCKYTVSVHSISTQY